MVLWSTDEVERMRRCMGMARTMAFEPGAVASLGTAATSVFAIGLAEGVLVTRRRGPGRLLFCLRYAGAQMLPSIIWLTKPALQLAKAWRMDGKALLRDLSAREEMSVLTCQTLRSIIAGFVGIAVSVSTSCL